ncbi:MAG: GTP-binding protein [Thermoplasmata archaeon]|nr:MAG: GTP-binding protein [Thermoplasmata archaeon]
MDVTSLEKQIKDIEDEIFNTQKNKATEHHIGKLKAKIARLREQADIRRSAGVKGKGFSIKKSGDATIGLIGFPSIGKSTLLNQLTNAESEIGYYDFTTLDVIPGMLHYKGTKIQILDLPGLIVGASKGKGRGKEIIAAIRNVDLIVLMTDSTQSMEIHHMTKELHAAGIRLNQSKPDVMITLTKQGGITIHTTQKMTMMQEKTMYSIASEYVTNADIIIRDNIDENRFIDAFLENRIYIPAIAVINKIDLISKKNLIKQKKLIESNGWKVIPISAKKGSGIDELKQQIFSNLNLFRIYMKPQGQKPDYDEPLILKKGETVRSVCKKIHRDFKQRFRYAQVWGTSGKYPGQKVGLDHELNDKDVLTVIITH